MTGTAGKATASKIILGTGENAINFCFEAFPKRKIVCAYGKPTIGLLVEIEPSADLNRPSVINSDLAIMENFAKFDLKHYE